MVAQESREGGANPLCSLAIPNQEVLRLINHWLAGKHDMVWYNAFLNHLLSGDIAAFADKLQKMVLQTFCQDDLSKKPEVFYHGFMLGLTVSLSENYDILSNHESGLGSYDVAIIPKKITADSLWIILEFKRARSENLEKAAQTALEQIKDRQYEAILEQRGISQRLRVAIAFKNKKLKVIHERVD